MLRPSRSVAAFCIAVVIVAALLPGADGISAALAEPIWVLLPDHTPADLAPIAISPDEQPLELFSILGSRGPPAISLT
jgi:hypothetical protein